MSSSTAIASADILTLPNRTQDCTIPINGSLPGAVIFLHGVNDPGACYETVEKGLCQGLGERLGRIDLAPGAYGVAYSALEAEARSRVLSRTERKTYDNPDAFLYARTEGTKTHSPFIPFYWGYRAEDAEITKDPTTGRPATLRGQNQHVVGHRLDYDFAREGGFFTNATHNIPAMYGEGFKGKWMTDRVTRNALGGNGSFMDDSPPRKYLVLAAHRLAMLVRTMRTIASDNPEANPEHETVTIVGHSQGTIIALLAQALLAQEGHRCADCLILVDSPYSVRETGSIDDSSDDDVQTPYARVQTLIDIVNEVTRSPYSIPELAQAMMNAKTYCGQVGSTWSAAGGERPPKQGDSFISFVERDNRGKVYCYFCPEDTVVGLEGVEGIGTFGVPDKTKEKLRSSLLIGKSYPAERSIPVMDVLRHMRFFTRMWTRLPRIGSDGKPYLFAVGEKPGEYAIRDKEGSAWADSKTGSLDFFLHRAKDGKHTPGMLHLINGEALTPPHVPEMYGNEAVRGHVDADGTDHAGKVAADTVSANNALGNKYAKMLWVPLPTDDDPRLEPDVNLARETFNDGKHADDQTREVRKHRQSGTFFNPRWYLTREETPSEVRQRMASQESSYEENNYHSAILNDTENHRWVTSMDVALGQAVTLDDPECRRLLLLMAGWRYTDGVWAGFARNEAYDRLDAQARNLLEATKKYFQLGLFPDESTVPTTIPPLVTHQTIKERRALLQEGALPEIDRRGARALEAAT